MNRGSCVVMVGFAVVTLGCVNAPGGRNKYLLTEAGASGSVTSQPVPVVDGLVAGR